MLIFSKMRKISFNREHYQNKLKAFLLNWEKLEKNYGYKMFKKIEIILFILIYKEV